MSYLQNRLHDDRRIRSSSSRVFRQLIPPGLPVAVAADCSAPRFSLPVVVNSTSYAFYREPGSSSRPMVLPAWTCSAAPADPLGTSQWTRLPPVPVRLFTVGGPALAVRISAAWTLSGGLRTSGLLGFEQSAGGTRPTPSSLRAAGLPSPR